MKIKKYNQFLKEELGLKDYLVGALLGTSILNTHPINAQTPSTHSSQVQSKVLSKIRGPVGIQSVINPDLDLVHGILGSKRLDDDFEKRVSDELVRLNSQGFKTDVDNIQIKTYIKDGKIITESSCDIVESKDGNSYDIFTTRGSIGDNYDLRHDNQIKGLQNRLESLYGGKSKIIKTFTISFDLNGTKISYKQSFFVCSKTNDIQITGVDINDLRENLKKQTTNQSIDLKSLKIDFDNLRISYRLGDTKIGNLSLIFDNQGNLENRLKVIKEKNPTLEILERGIYKNYEWVFSVIY